MRAGIYRPLQTSNKNGKEMVMSSASNRGQKDFLANSEMVKGIENSLFSAAHVNGIMLETMLNYNKKVFDFLQRRLGQDLKTAQKFTSCENLSDLGEECTEFCGRAIEDYSSEIAKLANMGFGLANQPLGRLQEEVVVPSACLLYTSPSPRDRTRSRMP